MNLDVLKETYSICQLKDRTQIPWGDPLCFVAQTEEELSLVCRTELVPENTLAREDGFRALRVAGVLDFSLIGILSGISTCLAKANIGIFVVSTYRTDYVLVKEPFLSQACAALAAEGYEIDRTAL